MALKKFIKNLEDVHEAIRDEYKPSADGKGFVAVIDGEEDTTALKNALERVRQEKQAEKDLRVKLEGEFTEFKAKTDIPALEKSWQNKLDKVTKDSGEQVAKATKALSAATIGREANALATAIAKAPKLVQPLIERRLQVELDTEGMPKVRVLDKDGKISALTLDDLKKEFVEDPDLAPVIIGSKASGGGAPPAQPAGGGSNKPQPEATLANSLQGFSF